jgi:hypothetical protein
MHCCFLVCELDDLLGTEPAPELDLRRGVLDPLDKGALTTIDLSNHSYWDAVDAQLSIEQVCGSLVPVAVGEIDLAPSRLETGPAPPDLVYRLEDGLVLLAITFDDQPIGTGDPDKDFAPVYDFRFGQAALDLQVGRPSILGDKGSREQSSRCQKCDCA